MDNLRLTIHSEQNQLHGNYIQYEILQNGNPLTYASGATTIQKTFRDRIDVTSARINKVNLSNHLQSFDRNPGFTPTSTAIGSTSQRCIVPHVVGGVTKYLVGGNAQYYNGNSISRIVRLNADGSIDNTFTPPVLSGEVRKILVDPISNKIYVAGGFTSPDNYIIRLNENGTHDGVFNPPVINGTVNDMIIDITDNNIIIVGGFTQVSTTSALRIAKLNASNGGLNGTGTTAFASYANGPIHSIKQQVVSGDTKYIIGGEFSTFKGASRNGIVRLNSNGTTDTSFVANMGNGVGIGGIVYTVETSSDGKILLGGDFNSYNNYEAGNFVRLNADGSIDEDYQIHTNNTVYAIEIDEANSKYYIGGDFTIVNELPVERMCRLFSTATGIDFTFRNYGYNSTVYDILKSGTDIYVVGSFYQYRGGVPVQSETVVPIANTETETLGNLFTNLTTHNLHPDITYSTNSLNEIYVDMPLSAATWFVQNIVDNEEYINIILSNSDYGVSPVVINTRSPHFIVTPLSASTSCTYEMRIFRGNYVNDLPSQPNYTITKPKIKAGQTSYYFDASPLCRDFLSADIDRYVSIYNSTQALEMGETESVWMSLKSTQYSGSTSGVTASIQYVAIDGYGYPEDGANVQPPDVLMTVDSVNMWKYGTHNIFFNTSGLGYILIEGNNTLPSLSVSVTGNTQVSNQFFNGIKVKPSNGIDDYVDYSFIYNSGDKIIKKRFYYVVECVNDVKTLIFKNKYGVLQSVDFTKKSEKKYDVDRKTYNRSTLNEMGSFNYRKHNEVTYMVSANEQMTLNTDWLNESDNPTFKELLLSDEVYLLEKEVYQDENGNTVVTDGRVRPVTITDSQFTEKTEINDKLFNYSISIKIAQSVINNIR